MLLSVRLSGNAELEEAVSESPCGWEAIGAINLSQQTPMNAKTEACQRYWERRHERENLFLTTMASAGKANSLWLYQKSGAYEGDTRRHDLVAGAAVCGKRCLAIASNCCSRGRQRPSWGD